MGKKSPWLNKVKRGVTMKVASIMTCERIQEFIKNDNHEAAYNASVTLTEILRKKAQGKYETISVDNETGGAE